jgi:hypothetical protein
MQRKDSRMEEKNVPYKKDIEKTLSEIGPLIDDLVAYGSEISNNFRFVLRGRNWEMRVYKIKQ